MRKKDIARVCKSIGFAKIRVVESDTIDIQISEGSNPNMRKRIKHFQNGFACTISIKPEASLRNIDHEKIFLLRETYIAHMLKKIDTIFDRLLAMVH
jgi:methionine synthase I (cobalamin-dependent)